MRVLILGCTGPSGILLAHQFLARYPEDGHAVLYARNPGKIPENISLKHNVRIVQGELNDEEAFEKAFVDYGKIDAVLSALGPKLKRGYPLDLPGTYTTLLRLMHTHSCTRLIALSTPSNADPSDPFSLAGWLSVTGIRIFAPHAYRAIVDSATVIRERSEECGVDWTLVRVPLLTLNEGERAVVCYQGEGEMGRYLSRRVMTEFFVDQIEGREWVGKQPFISSKPM